jgi:hypothetical protein
MEYPALILPVQGTVNTILWYMYKHPKTFIPVYTVLKMSLQGSWGPGSKQENA